MIALALLLGPRLLAWRFRRDSVVCQEIRRMTWSGDNRHITIVEVKAGSAGLGAVSQVLRYFRYIRQNSDPDTIIHCVIAAPSFQRQLLEWMKGVDPARVRLEQVTA